jgi:hypothetical protein
MNQADIIRMAREAGFAIQDDHIFADSETGPSHALCTETVKRFAALVEAAVREAIKWNSIHSCHADCQNPACVIVREAVAAEREACAKVCDDLPVPPYVSDNDAHIWDLTCVDCAEAIRARGQQ